jgi:hypothetical protein
MRVFGEVGVPSFVGVPMGWGFGKAFGEDEIVLPIVFPSWWVMVLG